MRLGSRPYNRLFDAAKSSPRPVLVSAHATAEQFCRTWHAIAKVQEPGASVLSRWASVNAYFVSEAALEGGPLLMLASLYLTFHRADNDLAPCFLMNCDQSSILQSFPEWSLGEPLATLEEFAPEFADALASHPSCPASSVSSDNWFFVHPSMISGQPKLVHGPWPAFLRRDRFAWKQTGAHPLDLHQSIDPAAWRMRQCKSETVPNIRIAVRKSARQGSDVCFPTIRALHSRIKFFLQV